MPNNITTLDDVVNAVRANIATKNQPQLRNYDLTPKSFQREGIAAVDYSVPIDAVYDRLSDGTYVPKYENYLDANTNEDRLARGQSATEQWFNGLGKNLTKVGVYALDATLGTAAGLWGAVTGDEDLGESWSNWADDTNKRLDNALPNYYSDEQKNMGFFRSLGTANFWANDVAGGLAFVGGALLPEAAIALATGGTSIPASIARAGLRTAGKSMFKAGSKFLLREGAEDLAKVAASKVDDFAKYNRAEIGTDAVRAFKRANFANKAGTVLNTGRFLAMTSNFEAGMEARHNYRESIDTYLSDFQLKNGRLPTIGELGTFSDEAKTAANWVYAGNMAILSLSNLAMFGKTFGVGIKAGKRLENAGNRLIGLGAKRQASGTLAMQEANRFQRITGKSYKILSKPAIEGIYEEGMQGVAGQTMQNYLKSKYDPDSEDAYGLWSSFSDAFAHQYGSKEGWKEMGIGMLIGFGAPVLQGQSAPGLMKDSWSSRRKELESQVAEINKTQANIHTRVTDANAISNFSKVMKSKADEYKSTWVDNAVIDAQHIKIQEQLKSHSEIQKDFDAVVDNMEFTDSQMSEIGGSDNLTLYKQSLKDEFKKNMEDYRFAKKTVASLGLDTQLKGVGKGNLGAIGDALTMNIMIGKSSLEAARNIGNQIGTLIGSEGMFSHMEHYNSLSTDKKKKIDQLKSKKQALSSAKSRANKYAMELAKMPTGTAEGKTKSKQDAYKRNSEKRVVAEQEVNRLTREIEELSKDLSEGLRVDTFDIDQTNSTDANTHDVERMVDELDKLDTFVESLEKSGRTSDAKMLSGLIEEFKSYSDAHREMNNTVRKMLDTNFFSTKKGKGFLGYILGEKYQMSDDFRQIIRDNDAVIDRSLNLVGVRGQESVERIIEETIQNNEELSDREKYRLESIIRLQLGYARLEQRIAIIKDETEISVAEEEPSGDPLEGDTVRLRSKLNTEGKDLGNLEVIDELISKITSELEEFRLGRVDNSLVQSLENQLEELKLQKEKQTATPTSTTLEPITAEEYKDFIDNNNVSKERLANIADKIKSNQKLTNEEEAIRQAKSEEVENLLVSDIDSKIKELEDELEKAKNTKSIRIVNSAEYLRLEELNKKLVQGVLTPSEIEELKELELDIDQWMTIIGIVAEGFRLSDLIKQKIALQNSIIRPIENVVTITSQEVLDSIDFGEKTTATNYSIGQSYDSVTAIMKKDNKGKPVIEISGINANDFAEEVGFPFPIKTDNQNNILIDEETRILINENSNISILPTNKNLTTNYSIVLKTTQNVDGTTTTAPLKSKFNRGFTQQQSPEMIYLLSKGDELVLEVDPTDPHNVKLLDEYKKAKTDKNKSKALENLKKGLVIKVKDKNENFVAVLKAKRENAIKNKEALIFEALRDKVVDDEGFIDMISEVPMAQQLDFGRVTVEKVYIGHPNFYFSKNADGTVTIDSKELTPQDIDKIDDIGYVQNGQATTRKGMKNIDMTFMNKVIKSPSDAKVPFIVFTVGKNRIAYPVKVASSKIEDLEEFRKIYESDTDIVDKATALNNYMAKKGIDIKLPGNSFISVGVNNVNDKFFSEKLAQLEKIEYFPNLENWVDIKSDMAMTLSSGVSIDINLSEPIFGPKVKMNLSELDVDTSASALVNLKSQSDAQAEAAIIAERDAALEKAKADFENAKRGNISNVDIEAKEAEALIVATNINNIIQSKEVSKTIDDFTNTNLDRDGKEDLLQNDIKDLVDNWGIDEQSVSDYMKQQGTTLVKAVWRNNKTEFFKLIEAWKKGKDLKAELATLGTVTTTTSLKDLEENYIRTVSEINDMYEEKLKLIGTAGTTMRGVSSLSSLIRNAKNQSC
jgi:hypothetical protein